MRKILTSLAFWVLLLILPVLTGCGGGDNKAEFPKEFAPPPKGDPTGVGTGKGPPGETATIPKK